MYFFTPDTIAQANKNIEALDSKFGGLLCVLHCLTENIEENISYTIDGEKLRKQLSFVFDKEPRDSFDNAKPSYIIFAKDWVSTFFENCIKNKVDLLSCAVFFLRRQGFEREYTKEEVIDFFVKRFNLKNLKERWFCDSSKLELVYNQYGVEDNQTEFYAKMEYTSSFKSVQFNNTIQKSASELKAAGQMQTLYSGSGIQTCFLLSDEPLDQYYIMSNIDSVNNVEETSDTELPTLSPRCSNKVMPLNFILYGAPGTGKTYATAEYAVAIIEGRKVDLSQKTSAERSALMEKYKAAIKEGRITFTTFHQSYGYEDFIQGLRPDTKNGGFNFVPVDGVFKRIADEAIKHGDKDYVIIIDEINRANISKVFGELITLIEEDKRWGEINALSVTLPSGQAFAVPNNLFIVGTMNSADKSISLIDAALRRRFDFMEVVPNASIVEDTVLKTVLERLNTELFGALESTDLLVGHAYFMGKEEKDLCDIMNHSIIPLLYEYFYDNSNKVKNILEKAVAGYNFQVTPAKVGRIRLTVKG